MSSDQVIVDRLIELGSRYNVSEHIEFFIQNYDIRATQGDSSWDRALKVLLIDPSMSDTELMATFIHEIEHIVQDWVIDFAAELAFNTGDFWGYVDSRVTREAYAIVAEMIGLGYEHGDHYGYVSAEQAENAYSLALLATPQGASEGVFEGILAEYLREAIKGNESGFDRIATDAANVWTSHFRDGFVHGDQNEPRSESPDLAAIEDAASLADTFDSYGDYDVIYVYRNEDGSVDIYAEKDGEPAWQVSYGYGVGGPGGITDVPEGGGRLIVAPIGEQAASGLIAQSVIFSAGQESSGVYAATLIQAMAGFSTPQESPLFDGSSGLASRDVLLAVQA